jgi:hypothetical protein
MKQVKLSIFKRVDQPLEVHWIRQKLFNAEVWKTEFPGKRRVSDSVLLWTDVGSASLDPVLWAREKDKEIEI